MRIVLKNLSEFYKYILILGGFCDLKTAKNAPNELRNKISASKCHFNFINSTQN